MGAPFFRRDQIEAEIEMHLARVDVLIARLDRMDPDPDLEDSEAGQTRIDQRGRFLIDMSGAPTEDDEEETDVCEAGDHGGGYVICGHRSGWGAPNDEGTLYPTYGIDQSQGPIAAA